MKRHENRKQRWVEGRWEQGGCRSGSGWWSEEERWEEGGTRVEDGREESRWQGRVDGKR